MALLFKSCPQALANTLNIAGRCAFDLTRDLGYRFPDYPAPQGYTPQSYLEHLCRQAAERRYGGVTERVRARLEQEFRLIEKHNLAGFFLIYHEIIELARQIMIELGLSDPEIPLEERPPAGAGDPRWPCWRATSSACPTSIPWSSTSPWTGSSPTTWGRRRTLIWTFPATSGRS
jgi:hypothetical protein